MLSFYSMAYAAEGAIESLNVNDQDRMLSYLPLAHVMERFVVEMASMSVGFKLYFADNLKTFVADLGRANPTLFLAGYKWLKCYDQLHSSQLLVFSIQR